MLEKYTKNEGNSSGSQFQGSNLPWRAFSRRLGCLCKPGMLALAQFTMHSHHYYADNIPGSL
ncbi:MAG: hypothetical protein SWO11_17040 [Thermodesulfobacteriota bacterium]|nr:hypothetical protein [Thermodesulfobacteriota bacterium]